MILLKMCSGPLIGVFYLFILLPILYFLFLYCPWLHKYFVSWIFLDLISSLTDVSFSSILFSIIEILSLISYILLVKQASVIPVQIIKFQFPDFPQLVVFIYSIYTIRFWAVSLFPWTVACFLGAFLKRFIL